MGGNYFVPPIKNLTRGLRTPPLQSRSNRHRYSVPPGLARGQFRFLFYGKSRFLSRKSNAMATGQRCSFYANRPFSLFAGNQNAPKVFERRFGRKLFSKSFLPEKYCREVAEDEGGFSGGMPTGAAKRHRHLKIGY